MLEWGAEGVIVGSANVVGVGEAGFLNAHGEDEVALGEDEFEGLSILVIAAIGEDNDGVAGCIVDEHCPVVGGPTARVEGPGTLCRKGCNGYKSHNDKG